MKRIALPGRWLEAVGTTLFMGTVLTMGSGCGALGAMANPKVAWAMQDPAPMTVVVRRADAAAATAKEIDRLLTTTPVNPDSDWVAKVGPSADDTKTNLKTIGALPMYQTSKARVVPSEVWVKTLPNVRSDAGKYPNLLAAVSPSLSDSYAKIMAKKQEIADLNAQKAAEDEAAGAKDATADDKKDHKDKSDALAKQISAAEDAVSPLQKDFLKTAKDAAGKASSDVKTKLGVAFVNLRQAADDADIAAGAAVLRYPIAIPGMKDAITQQAKSIAADVIEEKTGHRPLLNGLTPGVTFEGGKVGLTLNNISQGDLGKLSVGDLTSETLKRTQAWVGHTLTLISDVSKTKEILGFEEDTLDAITGGFKASGWTPPAPVSIDSTAKPGTATATAGASVSAPSAPKVPGL